MCTPKNDIVAALIYGILCVCVCVMWGQERLFRAANFEQNVISMLHSIGCGMCAICRKRLMPWIATVATCAIFRECDDASRRRSIFFLRFPSQLSIDSDGSHNSDVSPSLSSSLSSSSSIEPIDFRNSQLGIFTRSSVPKSIVAHVRLRWPFRFGCIRNRLWHRILLRRKNVTQRNIYERQQQPPRTSTKVIIFIERFHQTKYILFSLLRTHTHTSATTQCICVASFSLLHFYFLISFFVIVINMALSLLLSLLAAADRCVALCVCVTFES